MVMEKGNSRPLILAVVSLKTSQTWKKGKGEEGATRECRFSSAMKLQNVRVVMWFEGCNANRSLELPRN